LFLSTIGPLRKHKARADFTTGFFQVGGFDIESSPGTTDVPEAIKLTIDSGAKITVICGIDPDYETFVPDFCQQLKAVAPEIKIILAGYPGDKEEAYKTAGLDDYIFVKSNVYEVNQQYLQTLGVL
ncbi:MAG: methylmalonyl-CoA mutase, partial [Verrucomicrobiota bacterium]